MRGERGGREEKENENARRNTQLCNVAAAELTSTAAGTIPNVTTIAF